MATAEETIDRVDLFASLDKRARKRLAADLRERRYAAGEAMTSEDHGGVGFFLIGDGTAVVNIAGSDRLRLGPGHWFGEMALISGEARSARITAETDVQCWVLSQWHFKPVVTENPEVAWKLLQILASRLRAAQVPAPGE